VAFFLIWCNTIYVGVSKSFRTGRLERKLQMVQLSAIMRSCDILCQSSEFHHHNTLCCFSTSVLLLLLLLLISLSNQSGKFWIHPRIVELQQCVTATQTGYGLENRGFESRQMYGNFLILASSTAMGAHPTSYPMGTMGSFPEVKWPGSWSWPLTST
jgi:hypothetical protein